MTKSTTNKKKYIYIYKKISSTLKALPLPLAPHISENEENIRATFQLRTRDQIRNKGQTWLTICYKVKHILFYNLLLTIIDVLCCAVLSRSVMSDFLRPHGLQPARHLCPWRFSRQGYWSGLPCPLPRDIPNLRSNPGLPHCKWILHRLSHQESICQTVLRTSYTHIHIVVFKNKNDRRFRKCTNIIQKLHWKIPFYRVL